MNVSLLNTLNSYCVSTINLFFAADCLYEVESLPSLSTEEYEKLGAKEKNEFTSNVSTRKAFLTDAFKVGCLYKVQHNIGMCCIQSMEGTPCVEQHTAFVDDIFLFLGATKHIWTGKVWVGHEKFSVTTLEFLHEEQRKFVILGDNEHFYNQILKSVEECMKKLQ